MKMQNSSIKADGINSRIVKKPSPREFIKKCVGFIKKHLASWKIDLMHKCGFDCIFCTTDEGPSMQFQKVSDQKLVNEQIGVNYTPTSPAVTIEYSQLMSTLKKELDSKAKSFGKGQTLMFSQLTDAFSPRLVELGHTKKALDMIFEKTSFRVRILTKNAIVGDDDWIDYFGQHRDRVIVGLSTGCLDDCWAKKIEKGTSPPSHRFIAIKRLQDAGIPTYGMLCPIFPKLVQDGRVAELIEKINPDMMETIWAEPYNAHPKINWMKMRYALRSDPVEYDWFTQAYEEENKDLLSEYHTDLYGQLLDHSIENDWSHKLKYLLYESEINKADVIKFKGLVGVLLQNKPDEGSGCSKNMALAKLQAEIGL